MDRQSDQSACPHDGCSPERCRCDEGSAGVHPGPEWCRSGVSRKHTDACAPASFGDLGRQRSATNNACAPRVQSRATRPVRRVELLVAHWLNRSTVARSNASRSGSELIPADVGVSTQRCDLVGIRDSADPGDNQRCERVGHAIRGARAWGRSICLRRARAAGLSEVFCAVERRSDAYFGPCWAPPPSADLPSRRRLSLAARKTYSATSITTGNPRLRLRRFD